MNGTVIEQWGGHYGDGYSSDKVWSGAYTDQGEFIVAYGRRPNAVNGGLKNFGTAAAAREYFAHKVAEKKGKGYIEVQLDDPHYGLRSFAPATSSPGGSRLTPEAAAKCGLCGLTRFEHSGSHPGAQAVGCTGFREVGVTAASARELRRREAAGQASPAISAAKVYAIDADALDRARVDPGQAISEKLNGMRVLLDHDGHGNLTAYNRRAVPMQRGVLCADRLKALGGAFTLDGELLADSQGERYVAFDVLHLDDEDLRETPYAERIDRLRRRLREASIVASGGPTLAGAVAGSVTEGFGLLVAESGADRFEDVLEHVINEAGEGVIVRSLEANYQGGPENVRKFKFVDDIDVVGIGVRSGLDGGSIMMGLHRESDGALVEVGYVRSGLSGDDVRQLEAEISAGDRPVLTVTYLGARTVGIRLAEPRTTMDKVRTDKTPEECTTAQFGERRQRQVLAAPAIKSEVAHSRLAI